MRTRTACALALMVAVVGGVAAVGLRGVTRAVAAVDSILERDAKLLEHAAGLEARTLDLRRYEKDVFLHAGDEVQVAESFTKWKATHELATGHLRELQQLGGGENAATIAAMREDLAAYAAGFEEIVRGIGAGTVQTPEATDAATGAYEERIRRLDRHAAELAARSLRGMHAKGSVVADAGERTRASIWAICIAGIAVVWVVTIFLARGAAVTPT